MRESCQRLRQLLEVAATAGTRNMTEDRNMTEKALSILIIFPYNSNKPRPQTESCVFSSLVAGQHSNYGIRTIKTAS